MRSSLPKYMEIADAILDQIEAGKLNPGDRLHPERELSKQYGVTRTTIRMALERLEEIGSVSRQQGRGTFVTSVRIERQASKLVPFTKGMQIRGFTVSATLLSLQEIPSDYSRSTELGISLGETIYYVARIRRLNNEPVLLERLSVPAKLFDGLHRFDLEKRSLYEVMETEYGIVAYRAKQSLEPVSASLFEADLLGIKEGAPMMLERRLTYDRNNRPIEYGRDLFRGDRFRFVTEVAPLEDGLE